MTELGAATFFAHVRGKRASGAAILAPDGTPRLNVTMSLAVHSVADNGTPDDEPVNVPVSLLGPADVVGISPSEILRVFPSAHEPAAEPNYLAAIEFDSPEVPWLASLSPPGPVAMPWIALVVVPDEGNISSRPGTAMPWLKVSAALLPICTEMVSWAHVQVVGAHATPPIAPGDGRASLSRLLCPTRLRPNTRYVAAVVPTYLAGVMAARGEIPTGVGDRPAWEGGGEVSLPVYHHWSFTTGPSGDFELLAQNLHAVDAHDIHGLGHIDLHPAPGWLADLPTDVVLPALRTLLTTEEEVLAMAGESVVQPVKDALRDAINGDDEREVRPPKYGQWPAFNPGPDGGPSWYRSLNLSPSHRVLARLGADVVRIQQEELVAEAQRQLGEYQRARRARDLLRLGELTAQRLHDKALRPTVGDDRVIALARPALQALIPMDDVMVAGSVANTADVAGFGRALLAPSLARITNRASRVTRVSAGSMRAEFVRGALDGDLVALAPVVDRPPIDLGRSSKVFERAGLLDHVVGGVAVRQLVELAPATLTAQNELTAQFAGHTIDIVAQLLNQDDPVVVHGDHGHQHFHPHDDDGGGEEVIIPNLNVHAQDHVDVHAQDHIDVGEQVVVAGDHVDAAHQLNVDVAHQLNPVQLEQGVNVQAAQVHAFGAADLDQAHFEVAATRVDSATLTMLTAASDTTGQPLIQFAQQMGVQNVPAAPVAFTDLLVDSTTSAFATALQAAVAEPAAVPQFDVRTAVRRNLGLSTATPVLRDTLTDEDRQRFDDVIIDATKRVLGPDVRFAAAPPPVTAAAVAAPCRTGLEAARTYSVAATLVLPFAIGARPTEIVMGFVPKFDAPLAARLGRSLNAWILAGAQNIPPNSVTVVVTNPAFIEAVVAGANHEMARELLWRDVPADFRGTVFSRFWTSPEIKPIHTWAGDLGSNLSPSGSPLVAVVIRSPLLRRYPNAMVYAVTGTVSNDAAGNPNFEPDPDAKIANLLYTGPIAPDLTYSVINLTLVDAIDPAKRWHLILGEPISEPRFGADETADVDRGTLNAWSELAWSDFGDGNATMLRPGVAPNGAQIVGGPAWGPDAGVLAHILHQDPFRVVLPAAAFLQGGA